MRNLDTNKLTSLYESRIVNKEELISEEMPPMELGPSAGKPGPHMLPSGDEKHWKATMNPRDNPEYTKKYTKLTVPIMSVILNKVWPKVKAAIEKSPNAVFPGDADEFREQILYPALIEVLNSPELQVGGRSIYAPGFVKLHFSREMDNGLRRLGLIKYIPPTGVKKGRPKVDREQVANELNNMVSNLVAELEKQAGADEGGVPKIGEDNEDVMQHGGEPPYMQQNEIRYQKGK